MTGDDMRYYETFYAVHLNDWMETYGSFINHHKLLTCKVDDAGTKTELFTTGWITTGTTLHWDSVYSVGDEIVYPFRINAWDKAKLFDHERLFLRVQIDNEPNADLWHSNDATWEDIKIVIPFRM
jgi:hypothetical protein